MSLSQSFSNIFCSKSNHRRFSEERQSNETVNYRRSRLHNLPAEILYVIGNNTTGLTLNALVQVCKRFRAIFETLGEKTWVDSFRTSLRYRAPCFDGDDLTEYRLALQRDHYTTKCQRERQKPSPTNPLCSSCLQKHSRSKFTEDQIATDATMRTCKAAHTGGFQSCNHLIMPFSSLQRLRLRGALNHASSFGALKGQHDDPVLECPSAIGLHFCTESRRREFFHPNFGSKWNVPCPDEPMRYTEPFSYKLVLQYTVLSLSLEQGAYVSVVAHKLRTLTGMICSHIEMSSAEVLRSIYPGTLRAALLTSSTVRWINDWNSSYGDQYRWSKICSCKQPSCDTKFRFALDRLEKGRQKVHLVVQRDVGGLEDPNDPKWLAQRVIPLGYAP